jgi:hypothetical protein
VRRVPPEVQAAARRLRRQGLPYKRIAANLHVSVSSVYAWTKDIELTSAQKEHNLRGPRGPQSRELVQRRSAAWVAKCRDRRARARQDGRDAARRRDPVHHAGCMLYWAEGTKSRGTLKFSNSDPHMCLLFRRFRTEALAIELDEIVMTVNVYTNNGLTIDAIERYWLDLLGLPDTAVRKHTVNHMPTSSSGRAKNKLPYGVCTLRVESTGLLQHVYGAIQEYAGFDEPAWLD